MAGRSTVRCTFCGGRTGGGTLIEIDLRGVRYDYCDAACATAHRQAVELTAVLCPDCDEDALGDSGFCAEHVDPVESAGLQPVAWRRAG